jgi:hypothetical protein
MQKLLQGLCPIRVKLKGNMFRIRFLVKFYPLNEEHIL